MTDAVVGYYGMRALSMKMASDNQLLVSRLWMMMMMMLWVTAVGDAPCSLLLTGIQ